MRYICLGRLRRLLLWFSMECAVVSAVLVFSVYADNSSRLRPVPPGGCYCGCAQSKTSAGCNKMCELPKYASRWWATSCVKPRTSRPAENPGAGPHPPHNVKSERASR